MPSGCPICTDPAANVAPNRNAIGRILHVVIDCPRCGPGLQITAEALFRLDRGLFTTDQFTRLQGAVRTLDERARSEIIDAALLERLARYGRDGW